ESGDAIPVASFIQQIRRQRRRESQRANARFFAKLSVESGWPWRQVVVVREMALMHPCAGQPVVLVEVVIDLDVDLFAIVRIQILSGTAGGTCNGAANPAMSRGIQTVTDGAVVRIRQRHGADNFCDVSGRIDLSAILVARVER